MFVHSWFCPIRGITSQSFTLKFRKWGISQQPLIRKHSYLDHRYPGGLAFILWLLTSGSMPRAGAKGQNLGHLSQSVFLLSLLWKYLMQIFGQTLTRTCGSWSEGQHDLYFMFQWFCLIHFSWLFYVCSIYIILWEYESAWHNVWPKNKCRSLWPIFHGPVILPYILKTILCTRAIQYIAGFSS